MTVHMTQTQKQMARRLRAKGLGIKEIARELNYSADAIRVTVRDRQCRDGKPDEWSPAPGRLSAEEREEILVGLRDDESMSSIARRLGRSPSTVTREVAANGGRRTMARGGRTAARGPRCAVPSPPSWTTRGSSSR